MIEVTLYDCADDAQIAFVIMAARYRGKWVLCRHRGRETYECPGGHREAGETVLQAAGRELWEETGAQDFDLTPVCLYSVCRDGMTTYGMLYAADIRTLGPLPPMEIESIELFDRLPDKERWTYPEIQPLLVREAAGMEARCGRSAEGTENVSENRAPER